MYTIKIGDKTFNFNFGIGFLRDIDAVIQTEIPNVKGVKKSIGFRYYFSSLVDGDVQAFETILYHANVNQTPKITFKDLDSWIDNPETDIEKEMKDVQDFLLSSNACKKQTETMIKEIAEAEAKQKN